MNSLIENSIKYWQELPKDIFIPIQPKGISKILVIKFRDCNTDRQLFNTVEPYNGIKFIDLLSTNDYFIGEFIVINSKFWHITIGTKAIVLNPKFRYRTKKIVKERDDGFIKSYNSGNSIILTSV